MKDSCGDTSNRQTHHKLLSQFVADEVEALGVLGGGDRPPPRHHRPSRQQAVDLVEDVLELRSRVAGDLTDGDGGGFLKLALQLLCLRRETKPSELQSEAASILQRGTQTCTKSNGEK